MLKSHIKKIIYSSQVVVISLTRNGSPMMVGELIENALIFLEYSIAIPLFLVKRDFRVKVIDRWQERADYPWGRLFISMEIIFVIQVSVGVWIGIPVIIYSIYSLF